MGARRSRRFANTDPQDRRPNSTYGRPTSPEGANAYLVKPTSFQELEVIASSIRNFWLEHNQAGTLFSGARA